MALIQKRIEHKEEVIDGQVLGTEVFQTIDNLNGAHRLQVNTPIHFSTEGAHCYCGYVMLQEPVKQKDFTIKVCCMNRNCDQFNIDKVIKLPSTIDYQVISPNS